MIRARKGGPLQWMADRYVDGLFRRRFRALWVKGALPPAGVPLLVYANHSSWWDGFLAHQLCRAAGREGYCLVEERTLRRWPFLSRLGAFSIRPGDPYSALESLRYARALLRRERAALFVFPEGSLTPFGPHRPLQRGVSLLAQLSGATCVPVAFRCGLFEDELPDALVEIGAAHGPLPLGAFAERLASAVERAAGARSLEGYARASQMAFDRPTHPEGERRALWH